MRQIVPLSSRSGRLSRQSLVLFLQMLLYSLSDTAVNRSMLKKSNPFQRCLSETLSHLVHFTVCPISLSSTGCRCTGTVVAPVKIKDLRFVTYVCVFLCVIELLMCVCRLTYVVEVWHTLGIYTPVAVLWACRDEHVWNATLNHFLI